MHWIIGYRMAYLQLILNYNPNGPAPPTQIMVLQPPQQAMPQGGQYAQGYMAPQPNQMGYPQQGYVGQQFSPVMPGNQGIQVGQNLNQQPAKLPDHLQAQQQSQQNQMQNTSDQPENIGQVYNPPNQENQPFHAQPAYNPN